MSDVQNEQRKPFADFVKHLYRGHTAGFTMPDGRTVWVSHLYDYKFHHGSHQWRQDTICTYSDVHELYLQAVDVVLTADRRGNSPRATPEADRE